MINPNESLLNPLEGAQSLEGGLETGPSIVDKTVDMMREQIDKVPMVPQGFQPELERFRR